MEEFIVKDGKKLRLGYTTGSCAAAAAKAAGWMLLSGKEKNNIRINTPKGIELDLEVKDITFGKTSVKCAIEKDCGDDPDITGGSLIYAEVSCSDNFICKEYESSDSEVRAAVINIDGGSGVGRVTKKGLDQPVGNAAINSVPRRMIKEGLEEVCRLFDYHGEMNVIISVPDGEKLAVKTFNPRLGIVGGISILGTTGIVEPMSEEALIDTIKVELSQRRANGAEYVLLTPGNYGTEFIENNVEIDPKLAVMTSNFIGESLNICKELGFKGILLIGHIGKLVKLAGGMMNTHSKYGDCRMDIMAAYSGAEGLKADRIGEMLECVTCDDAIRILEEEKLTKAVLDRLTKRIAFIMDNKVHGEMKTAAVLFSRVYGELCETENAGEIFELIRKENL